MVQRLLADKVKQSNYSTDHSLRDEPKLVPGNYVKLISEEEALIKLAQEVEHKKQERMSRKDQPKEDYKPQPAAVQPATQHHSQPKPNEPEGESTPLLGRSTGDSEKKGCCTII